jgi:acyl carrier protein
MEDSKQEEVICKLKIIFEKLLDLKIENLDDLVFGIIKNWDSLKHLQIIINVEKEFSTKIKTSDVITLTSFNKIKDYILSN